MSVTAGAGLSRPAALEASAWRPVFAALASSARRMAASAVKSSAVRRRPSVASTVSQAGSRVWKRYTLRSPIRCRCTLSGRSSRPSARQASQGGMGGCHAACAVCVRSAVSKGSAARRSSSLQRGRATNTMMIPETNQANTKAPSAMPDQRWKRWRMRSNAAGVLNIF